MQIITDETGAQVYDVPAYDTGDVAWTLCCTFGVFLMVPGLGFLYSGLARRKSALSMLWLCMMSGAMAMFTWWFWAYSLAFSTTSNNKYIGDLRNFALRNTTSDDPDTTIPELLVTTFQGMFAAVTAAILAGGAAERGRFMPFMLFIFCWITIVYAPLAYWVWGSGWASSSHWGVLDFAGGGPVEIGSGVGGACYAMVLGRRHEKLLVNFRPHNISFVILGTILLWFGWLSFNAGSAGGANLRAVYAVWNSNLTAIFAAFSWVLLDFRLERKWSTVAICSGFISGLVAATPASGCIPLWGSIILGFVSGIACNFSTQIKYLLGIDDSMDTFAEHGVAGIIGLFFNAFLGDSMVINADGSEIGDGGWMNQNWKQLYKQFAYICACFGYVAALTTFLAFVINYIPGFKLRVSEDAEARGVDEDQIGEFAYDYVEVRRDYLAWAPPATVHNGESASPKNSEAGAPTHEEAEKIQQAL